MKFEISDSIQQIFLNLGEYILCKLYVKGHHIFNFLPPLIDNLIDQKSSVKHRSILTSKAGIWRIFNPVRVKARMVKNYINEKHHPFLFEFSENTFELIIFLLISANK